MVYAVCSYGWVLFLNCCHGFTNLEMSYAATNVRSCNKETQMWKAQWVFALSWFDKSKNEGEDLTADVAYQNSKHSTPDT